MIDTARSLTPWSEMQNEIRSPRKTDSCSVKCLPVYNKAYRMIRYYNVTTCIVNLEILNIFEVDTSNEN